VSTILVKAGALAEQLRGVSYGKEDASDSPLPGYLPVLRAGNITDDGLIYDDLVFVPQERISEKQKIRRHDVVIAASSGSVDVVGKAAPALADFEGSFGAFCKVLRPNAKVHPSYFAHFFKTPNYRRRVSALAAGANINNLRNEHLDDMEIPLPPLAEQRRIAAVLDRAETLRAKRRVALAHLDTLTQCVLLDLFGDPATNPKGWPIKRLDELCRGITDIDHKMPVAAEEGWPFISAKDLTDDGRISFENVKRISDEDFRRLSRKSKPEKGDIIYSRIGVNLGKARIVQVEFPFLASYSCCTIKPDHELVDASYLCTLLDSPFMLKQAHRGVRAIAVPDLGMGEIKSFIIILPPLSLQREFARRVTAVEKLRTAQRASLAELDALFASLQHRAFRGEL